MTPKQQVLLKHPKSVCYKNHIDNFWICYVDMGWSDDTHDRYQVYEPITGSSPQQAWRGALAFLQELDRKREEHVARVMKNIGNTNVI